MKKVHNFSAGPGILPAEVIKQSAEAVLNFDNLNLSLLEISHRSKNFIAVMDQAVELVKDLLKLPSGYSVIFVGGGASTQFAMVPYNLLKTNGTAGYLNTGVWASKAIKEAKIIGNTQVIASSEDKQFSYIPKGYTIPDNLDYMHITSNNTIYGTQLKEFPKCPVSLVCDMSSDIFSREINAADFDLIYAGAQKNMGPAGATLVVVKDEILGKTGRTLLSMLDYRTHIKAGSMYNTPPVYPIYVSMLTMKWLKDNGGVSWIEKINEQIVITYLIASDFDEAEKEHTHEPPFFVFDQNGYRLHSKFTPQSGELSVYIANQGFITLKFGHIQNKSGELLDVDSFPTKHLPSTPKLEFKHDGENLFYSIDEGETWLPFA